MLLSPSVVKNSRQVKALSSLNSNVKRWPASPIALEKDTLSEPLPVPEAVSGKARCTCLDSNAARPNIQPHKDHSNVRRVEDLCQMC